MAIYCTNLAMNDYNSYNNIVVSIMAMNFTVVGIMTTIVRKYLSIGVATMDSSASLQC